MTMVTANIDEDTTLKAIQAVVAKAKEIGKPMSVAICDEGGNLKGFLRMDGASLMGSKICQDKAYTSAAARRPTHAYYDRIKDDPPLLHGMVHQPRLIIFGGGYPIFMDGQCIGAIGVSGGHWSEDMECALAAIRAIGAKEST